MATIVLRGVKGSPLTNAEVDANFTNLNQELSTKQNILVSGTNIKTINGASIVGSGNLEITVDLAAYADTGLPVIRPSLNLDFANSKTVDPRITFTRESTAGYFDDKGIYRQAAVNQPRIDHDPATGECKGLLIEESRTNSFPYSEDFLTFRTIYGAYISQKVEIAPDGKLTAVKLTESTNSDTHRIEINQSLLSGTTNAFSVYAKAAGRSELRLEFGRSTLFSETGLSVFNLLTGQVISSIHNKAKIEPLGNGWYRCSIVGVRNTEPPGVIVINITIQNTGQGDYQGDGVSGIYLWGAQTESGFSFPTSYIPTPATFTSRASEGTYFDSTGLLKTAAINEARYDHGLVYGVWVPKGLLLEPQRTNLLKYSEQFDNPAWDKSNTGLGAAPVIVANATTAPDGSVTADEITLNCIGTTSSDVSNIAQTISVTPVSYVASFWIKAKSTGDVGKTIFIRHASAVGYRQITLTAEWTRIQTIETGFDTGSTTLTIRRIGSASPGDIPVSFYIWGAQLEEIPAGQSPEPSSYIKTEATAVTRSADVSTSSAVTRAFDSAVMTGENFSSWYNLGEGTFVTKHSYDQSSTYKTVFAANDGTVNNLVRVIQWDSGTERFMVSKSALSQAIIPRTGIGRNGASSYAIDDATYAADGVIYSTDTSVQLPIVDRLSIGSTSTAFPLNGHIAKLSYYPKRLPDDELVQLSSE